LLRRPRIRLNRGRAARVSKRQAPLTNLTLSTHLPALTAPRRAWSSRWSPGRYRRRTRERWWSTGNRGGRTRHVWSLARHGGWRPWNRRGCSWKSRWCAGQSGRRTWLSYRRCFTRRWRAGNNRRRPGGCRGAPGTVGPTLVPKAFTKGGAALLSGVFACAGNTGGSGNTRIIFVLSEPAAGGALVPNWFCSPFVETCDEVPPKLLVAALPMPWLFGKRRRANGELVSRVVCCPSVRFTALASGSAASKPVIAAIKNCAFICSFCAHGGNSTRPDLLRVLIQRKPFSILLNGVYAPGAHCIELVPKPGNAGILAGANR